MRPHPRRLVPVLLVAGALVAVAPAVSAVAEPGAFTASSSVDPALRYPLRQPVDGRVESLIGGGCPSARAHSGIDISSPGGSPTEVHAAYEGFARAIQTGNGYGLTVEIVHLGDGTAYLSRYAHLSAAAVPPEGRWVAQGDVVGATGATGNAQTVHLHFELRDAADAVVDLNPAFGPCRRDLVAGTPLALDVPGLVSPAARAADALAPNTWAAMGVAPGATAPVGSDCRYWERATEGLDRCGDGGDGVGRGRGAGLGVVAGG